MLDRRELLGWLSGYAASTLLAPLSADDRLRLAEALPRTGGSTVFTVAQTALVAALADAIIPRTDTPGALDVEVPAFIARLIADWYTPEEANQLRRGLDAIDARATERFGRPLPALAERDRTALLSALDQGTGAAGSAEQAFGRIKSLTVYGYFTSKRVQTEVLKTAIIPGRFDGCIPFPS